MRETRDISLPSELWKKIDKKVEEWNHAKNGTRIDSDFLESAAKEFLNFLQILEEASIEEIEEEIEQHRDACKVPSEEMN